MSEHDPISWTKLSASKHCFCSALSALLGATESKGSRNSLCGLGVGVTPPPTKGELDANNSEGFKEAKITMKCNCWAKHYQRRQRIWRDRCEEKEEGLRVQEGVQMRGGQAVGTWISRGQILPLGSPKETD